MSGAIRQARRWHRVARAIPRASGPGPSLGEAAYDPGTIELVGREARLRLGDGCDAEDAAQEAARRVLEANPGDVPYHWVTETRKIAYQLRWWKERHGDEPAGLLLKALFGGDPEQAAMARLTLQDMLAALSPAQRSAMLLWIEGFSICEAAWKLRISPAAFAMRLHAARKRIKEAGLAAVLGGVARRRWQGVRRRISDLANGVRFATLLRLLPDLSNETPSQLAAVLTAALIVGTGMSSRVVVDETPRGGLQAPREVVNYDPATAALTVSKRTDPSLHGLQGNVVNAKRLPGDIRLGNPQKVSVGDVQLVALAAAPRYDENHTLVGLGAGPSACNCAVVFESTDGGATWSHGLPGPTGYRIPWGYSLSIVLPPDFPRDQRVFVSSPAQPGLFDYMSQNLGQTFQPLPMPPGPLAVSAGFDNGDPRVFVSDSSGVLAYNVDTAVSSPVVLLQTGTTAPLLATPYGYLNDAILVLAPGRAIIGGQVTTAASLVECLSAGTCHPISSQGVPVNDPFTKLVLSPNYASDQSILLQGRYGLAVSTDGGRMFRDLAPLNGERPIDAALGSTSRIWLLARDSKGGVSVLERQFGESTWNDKTTDQGLVFGGELTLAGPRILVTLRDLRGLRCSADSGTTWATSCPAS